MTNFLHFSAVSYRNNRFFSFNVYKLVAVIFAFLLLSVNVWGQTNSYLGLDGGFEGSATIDNTATGNLLPVASKWVKANTNITIAGETSTVRSGSKSLKVTSASTSTSRIWSPLVSISSSTTKWIVQYYRRATSTTATIQNQSYNYRETTETGNGSYSTITAINTWEKVTYAPTSVTAATAAAAGILGKMKTSTGDMFFDDFCLYESSTGVDVTAASEPTSFVGTPSPTSIDVSWTAASGGVDGGGYLVVRGIADPSTAPNTNGIYAVGNTIAAGMTVVYQGTGTSFTDSPLSSGTTYYYRIYTYDKAYNYSAALTGNSTTTSAGALTPPTLTADATANTVDNNIDITFPTDGAWESAITAVKIGATTLTVTTDYVISAGNIQLKPLGLNALLTASGSKSVTVVATGYTDATVTQVIGVGADAKLTMKTQPTAPASNGAVLAAQPAVYIQDQYGNTTASTASVVAGVGAGAWTLGGTSSVDAVAGTTTFSGLTASSEAAVTGATITFTSTGLTPITSATFNIPGPPAPTLTAASSPTVDAAFDVTFTDNATWRSAITSITVGGTALTSGYSVSAGKITFTPSTSIPTTLLQTSGSKSIAIIATGYANATVTQSVGVGADAKLTMKTQPTAPASNGAVLAAQPAVYIQDQYGNTTASTASVVAAVETGSWSLGGTVSKAGVAGTATYTGLTATCAAAVTGATITFTSTGLTPISSNSFNIPVLSSVPSVPTSLSFATITSNSFTASFVAPGSAPTGYIVLRTSGTAVTGTPVAGTVYSQGQTNIGSGTNEVMYVGTSVWTATAQSSLLDNTTYHYAVYSYNGTGLSTNYSATALTGSQATSSIAAPTASAATGLFSNRFTANWDAVTGASSYKLDVSSTALSSGTLTEGFAAGATAPANWTFTTIGGTYTTAGNFGLSSPSLQMDATGDKVQTPVLSGEASQLSFWIKGNGTNASSALLVEGFNGSSWSTIQNITNSIPTTGTTYTYTASTTPALPSGMVQFRFTYTKNAGNLAFDDVSVIWATSPTYISGYQDLTVSGTSQLVTSLSPNTNYYYRVRAVGTNSTSANSNSITATTPYLTYTISTSSSSNGSATATNTYNEGATVSLTATPTNGSYRFVNWTEGASIVSTTNPFVFTASADRTLVANFDVAAVTIAGGTNTDASTFASCATCDLAITGTGTTLTVDEPKTVNNVIVEAGSHLDVSGTNTLTVNGDLIFKADGSNSFSTNIGSGGINVTGSVSYERAMDDTRWYFMAFPFPLNVADITNTATGLPMGGNLIIKYYDGANRANGHTGSNWVTNAAATLTANQGYIFGISSGSFNVRFPLPSTLVNAEALSSITIAALPGSGANNHWGWNLISQPYLSTYNGTHATGVNFVSIPDATGTTYNQISINAASIHPFEAYFVQYGLTPTISFALDGRSLSSSSVSTETTERLQLNFESTTGKDNTSLILNDANSSAYEAGYDLEKIIGIGTAKPQVYTVLSGVNYAFNALPMSNVVNLPVGIYTKTAGNTTISVDATLAPSLSKLLLTDNKSVPATVTDLLTSSYTYTASAGTDNTRFVITAQRIPTSIDNNNGTEYGEIIILNGKLLIKDLSAKTNVRIYDAIGHLIVNKVTNNNSIEIPMSIQGMYTIQVKSGVKSWTKKIVYIR